MICFHKMKTSCWKLSQTPSGGQPGFNVNLICEALSGLWIDTSPWLCLDASSTLYTHTLYSLSLSLSSDLSRRISRTGKSLARIRKSRKKLHKNVRAQQLWVDSLQCRIPLWFKRSLRESKCHKGKWGMAPSKARYMPFKGVVNQLPNFAATLGDIRNINAC